MGVDDVLIVFAEQGLRGGADAVALFQLVAAAHSNPSTLRGKALDVVVLLLQEGFGDQHRHIDIFRTGLFKRSVHQLLDIFPDRVAVWAVNKHALDGGIVDQLRLFAYVCIPLGKVNLHIGDLFHFFLFCHCDLPPFRFHYGEPNIV